MTEESHRSPMGQPGADAGQGLWQACVEQLAQDLPEQQFNTWIKPLIAQVAEDFSKVTLLVGNRFKLDWIRAQYAGRIAALLELGTGFNPEFTGRENIVINAAILGLSQREIAERLDDIIAFADIGPFIDQPVKTYSSGMYVRLAFAVVVHVNPDILIVDEALAVGDALFQAKCMTRMRRMLDDGLTLLFISHDIAAVKALCQRALWLDHGRVRALGATPEVTRDYDHDWIRQANAAHDLPTDAPAAAAASDAEALLPSGVGTGAVALLAVGWGVAGMFGTEARAQHGDTLHLRLRLRRQSPQDAAPCA
mgnify:CR=1 FL=1